MINDLKNPSISNKSFIFWRFKLPYIFGITGYRIRFDKKSLQNQICFDNSNQIAWLGQIIETAHVFWSNFRQISFLPRNIFPDIQSKVATELKLVKRVDDYLGSSSRKITSKNLEI